MALYNTNLHSYPGAPALKGTMASHIPLWNTYFSYGFQYPIISSHQFKIAAAMFILKNLHHSQHIKYIWEKVTTHLKDLKRRTPVSQ